MPWPSLPRPWPSCHPIRTSMLSPGSASAASAASAPPAEPPTAGSSLAPAGCEAGCETHWRLGSGSGAAIHAGCTAPPPRPRPAGGGGTIASDGGGGGGGGSGRAAAALASAALALDPSARPPPPRPAMLGGPRAASRPAVREESFRLASACLAWSADSSSAAFLAASRSSRHSSKSLGCAGLYTFAMSLDQLNAPSVVVLVRALKGAGSAGCGSVGAAAGFGFAGRLLLAFTAAGTNADFATTVGFANVGCGVDEVAGVPVVEDNPASEYRSMPSDIARLVSLATPGAPRSACGMLGALRPSPTPHTAKRLLSCDVGCCSPAVSRASPGGPQQKPTRNHKNVGHAVCIRRVSPPPHARAPLNSYTGARGPRRRRASRCGVSSARQPAPPSSGPAPRPPPKRCAPTLTPARPVPCCPPPTRWRGSALLARRVEEAAKARVPLRVPLVFIR